MKKIVFSLACCAGLLFASAQASKDSLKLLCPLDNAVQPPPEKQPYSLGVEEPKIVLASSTDTLVKACLDGTVTNIMRDDDGKWEIMFNNKDYYFFYSGMRSIKVARGQKVKRGESLGILRPNDRLELMVYDFETPLDPKRFLDCGHGTK